MLKNDSISEAFTRHSKNYDEISENNLVLKWMRSIVYKHIDNYLDKNNHILEINAGTGLDAVYFANKGHKVHCIDISDGMIEKIEEKIERFNLSKLLSTQTISFSDLKKVNGDNYDYIFSNFGGLNCTKDIKDVIDQFKFKLKKNGRITLVFLPKICPWEILSIFKVNFKIAFRRFSKAGVLANIDGIKFMTYYYNVSELKKILKGDYKILKIQGLGSIYPPPPFEKIINKYPNIFDKIKKIEEKISLSFPFNRWADHIIITAELK